MVKRKVQLTVTRYYSKQISIEVEIDEDIKDDKLVDYLVENRDIENDIEMALLKNELLTTDDTTYEYSDDVNNSGGHF